MGQRQPPFGRVLTAMVTPFSGDGAVDLDLAARLADHLVDHGSDGLVLCGTTGESPTLSWQEQHDLFDAVKTAVAGRATVLAGRGSNCTAEAIEAIRQAAEEGADGALVVVPLLQQATPGGAGGPFPGRRPAAPGLPVMLYNIPAAPAAASSPVPRPACSISPPW
jgi:4-hydroxy-tetrahydrodipicolinate synthase